PLPEPGERTIRLPPRRVAGILDHLEGLAFLGARDGTQDLAAHRLGLDRREFPRRVGEDPGAELRRRDLPGLLPGDRDRVVGAGMGMLEEEAVVAGLERDRER